MVRKLVATALLALAGCATRPVAPVAPIEVQILALNDFHGNLERPAGEIRIRLPSDQVATMAAGGAAVLGAELAKLRAGHPNSITVAAGDLIGASPLTSAYFLDEPAIEALNLMGLDLASVGNHEFDKGAAELFRMQHGGCQKFMTRVPCRVERFGGARFQYLAANVVAKDGKPIFPPTAIRQFGRVKIGFIGMTLKETGTLVAPAGVAGLGFVDEAATANALVPELKRAGADAIVLLIHQGGKVPATYLVQGCAGLSGDILPVLDRLDPTISVVVSGHTHHAYACEIERGRAPRLLTSAGKYGYVVSDIRLSFDPSTRRLIGRRAANVPMAGDGSEHPRISALVKRYADAAEPAAARVVGKLKGDAPKSDENGESPAANLIADAQLFATTAKDRGNADLSFINATGVRVGIMPAADGSVTYGQIFAAQPFGNNLVVKTLTGGQLKALLEQQFVVAENGEDKVNVLLVPSANFKFSYDLSMNQGEQIVSMTLNGEPIEPAKRYRVTVNNFLASGGDGFSVLTRGTDAFDAGLDLDAMEAWLATNPTAPAVGRTIHAPTY
jgi:5'-nucleotidase